jgi:hypothetical protein
MIKILNKLSLKQRAALETAMITIGIPVLVALVFVVGEKIIFAIIALVALFALGGVVYAIYCRRLDLLEIQQMDKAKQKDILRRIKEES